MNNQHQGDFYLAPPAAGPLPTNGPRERDVAVIALWSITALALAVAVTAGLWAFIGSRGTGKPVAKEYHGPTRLPWSIPDGNSAFTNPVMVRGIWFMDRTVVKARPEGIHGFDQGTGKLLWSIPVPRRNQSICQGSTEATDNIVVLAYGRGEECDAFYAVDLAARRVLWERTIPPDQWATTNGTRIARSGGTVVVSTDKHLPTAFRVSDGKLLWKDPEVHGKSSGLCRTTQYTGGKQLVRIQHCSGYSNIYYLSAVDSGTGRDQWRYRTEAGLDTRVLSTSPIIIDEPDQGDHLRMTVIDDNGQVRRHLAIGPGHHALDIDDDGSTPTRDVQVKGDKIFVIAEKEHYLDSDKSQTNKVAAWSLTTGKQLWVQETNIRMQTYKLVDSDTQDIFAYSSGSTSDLSLLVKFNPDNGTPTIVRRYDPTVPEAITATEPIPVLRSGILYLSAGFQNASRSTDDWEKSLIALPGS
ncbi:PQQ-binding-like beta-propeller repeat protein [Streptomyces sp. NPDC052396]|uniref:outer membrane protein assembly factor BamB family protein n=1 Tax=Streptomyces sp. NPDC052396 TaxID=3365689 RepID=UPI0037D454EB